MRHFARIAHAKSGLAAAGAISKVGMAPLRAAAAALSASAPPPTPDYNTPVDVANIKLSKPARKKWVPPAPRAGSLIHDTLKEMAEDEEFQLSARKLKEMGQKKLTLEERKVPPQDSFSLATTPCDPVRAAGAPAACATNAPRPVDRPR